LSVATINDLEKKSYEDRPKQLLDDGKLFIASNTGIALVQDATRSYALSPHSTRGGSISLARIRGGFVKLTLDIYEDSDFTTGSGVDLNPVAVNRNEPFLPLSTLEYNPTIADDGDGLTQGVVFYGTAGVGNSTAFGEAVDQAFFRVNPSKKYIFRITNNDSATTDMSITFYGVMD